MIQGKSKEVNKGKNIIWVSYPTEYLEFKNSMNITKANLNGNNRTKIKSLDLSFIHTLAEDQPYIVTIYAAQMMWYTTKLIDWCI